jgi:hypothetical protein
MNGNHWTVINGGGGVVADNMPLEVVGAYLTPERFERGWQAVCVISNMEQLTDLCPEPLPDRSPRHTRYSNVAPWECPKCGAEEWDRVDAERGRERDVPFNRCCRCGNEWEAD